jgi:hypothetical protein
MIWRIAMRWRRCAPTICVKLHSMRSRPFLISRSRRAVRRHARSGLRRPKPRSPIIRRLPRRRPAGPGIHMGKSGIFGYVERFGSPFPPWATQWMRPGRGAGPGRRRRSRHGSLRSSYICGRLSGLAIGELEQDVGVAGLIKRTPPGQIAAEPVGPQMWSSKVSHRTSAAVHFGRGTNDGFPTSLRPRGYL